MIRTNDRIIGGVCGAIARRFNMSTKMVRILSVASFFFLYITIIIYIVLWVSTPYEDETGVRLSQFSLQSLFDTKHLPKWFIRFSYLSLYPILFWPLIFFVSIFMFDNPQNVALTFLYFILINCYPFFFIAIVVAGFKTYSRQKLLAVLLPFIPFLSGLSFIYFMFFN